jgi:hypothetical protein
MAWTPPARTSYSSRTTLPLPTESDLREGPRLRLRRGRNGDLADRSLADSLVGERDMNGMEAVPRSAPSIHARQTTDAMP